MERNIKKLLEDSGVMATAKALSSIFEILKNFVLIAILSVESFALITLVNNLASFNKYFDLGFANKLIIDSYDGKFATKKKQNSVFSAVFAVDTTIALSAGVLFYIWFSLGSSSSKASQQLTLLYLVLACTIFVASRIYRLAVVGLKAKRKFKRLAVIQIFVSFMLTLAATSLLFDPVDPPLYLYFTLQISIFLMIGAWVAKPFLSALPNFSWLRENLVPSLLLVGATAVYGFSFYFDRFILLSYYSLYEFGQYAFLLVFMGLAGGVITYALQPYRVYVVGNIQTKSYFFLEKVKLWLLLVAFMILLLFVYLYFFAPALELLLYTYLSKYSDAISNIPYALLVITTYPMLFMLGYLIVAKPFQSYKYYLSVQIVGLATLIIFFSVINDTVSIYERLLLSLYVCNCVKSMALLWWMLGFFASRGACFLVLAAYGLLLVGAGWVVGWF